MVACDRIEKRVEILLPKLEIPGVVIRKRTGFMRGSSSVLEANRERACR